MKKSLITGLAVAVGLAFMPAAFAQSSQGAGISNNVQIAQADKKDKKKKSSKKGKKDKKKTG